VHIILLIMKIVGIILLVLLLVLLLIILLVLFIPIKYRANAEKQEEIKVRAVVKWLFPLLYAKVDYLGESITYRICILGITIYPRIKKEKVEKPKKQKEKKKRKSEEEPDLVIMEIPESSIESNIDKEKASSNAKDETLEITNNKDISTDKMSKNTNARIENNDKLLKKTKKIKKQHSNESNRDNEPKVKKGLFERLKEKLALLLQKMLQLKEKASLIIEFLKVEENKKGLLYICNSLKHILKHIAPSKIQGDIEFGLEDPCQTGQALGVVSVLFSIYGKSIRIVPNFEEACINGKIFIKGRIRVFTLLVICIKLLLDDNFKRLKINFEKMKEAF